LPQLIEPNYFLPLSEQPTTRPYSEPDEFSLKAISSDPC